MLSCRIGWFPIRDTELFAANQGDKIVSYHPDQYLTVRPNAAWASWLVYVLQLASVCWLVLILLVSVCQSPWPLARLGRRFGSTGNYTFPRVKCLLALPLGS